MKVGVVGGGLAGLAAATGLIEHGARVELFEAAPVFGGRLASWPDTLADGTTFQMERGFHAFFRHYHNLRSLMARVGATRRLQPVPDYPILGPDGAAESFRGLPRRAPWNVMALVARTPTMGLRDLLRVHARRAASMLAYDAALHARWDDRNARTFLDGLGFPPQARRMLFEVFAHSFFCDEDEYSAGELLAQLHFYFLGNPEGLLFDCLDAPFGPAFVEPLVEWLRARGATLHPDAPIQTIERETTRWTLRPEDGARTTVDALVLALDVGGLRALAASSPDLALDVRHATSARPFVVWRRWLDRPARPERPAFAGTAGWPLLDNISLFDRLEDESRAWAARTNGAVVELHAYGVPPDAADDDIRSAMLEGLHALYPELRGAGVVDERYLRRADCPAFPPGSALRPGVAHRADVALAGDWLRLPYPSALMERAVASGFEAANHLLGRAAVTIRRPPVHGLLRRGLLRRGPLSRV